ncbi:YfhO family protein [Paenibacillus crassostreae]|uniref:Bacterial membrane protein YfhO n=1 Tax=Paenibacillus crassostreae TaxID=1763538 RepID=A0A167E2C7_9BACL|nr:YfhO family protein [Paenibacillus crassostreae]AOZ93304.1 hypothetical protein LPB68_14510 [Paenibacillus crassostreae]OAB75050.1 hypothetical protein PNBC_09425 [Paenibacillus crassostreae]
MLSKKKGYFVVFSYFVIPFIFYFNFLGSSGYWAPGDGYVSYAPIRYLLAESISNWKLPLWNSYINLGTPFHADTQNAIFYFPNLLFYLIFPFKFAFNYMFLFHLTLAGLFTYLYLKKINLDWKAAYIGGIVFMFSGVINAKLGHVTVMNSIVWLPLILYFYECLLQSKKKVFIVLMSLSYSMQIFAGFPQIALYTAIILLIYFIVSIKKYKTIKNWFIDKLHFSIITIGVTAIQLIPLLVLAIYSGRTKIDYEYFSSYSLEFTSLTTLFFPNIFGVHIPNSPLSLYNYNYFGPGNLTEFALYIGIIPLIFAVLVCIKQYKQDYYVKTWIIISIIVLILALGSSIPVLNKIMFHVPLYNSFRVSARFLFGFSFGITVLFAKQVDILIRNKGLNTPTYRMTAKLVGITLLISIACISIIHKLLGVISNNSLGQNLIIKGHTLEQLLYITSYKNPAVIIPLVIMLMSLIVFVLLKKITRLESKYMLLFLTLFLLLDLHSFSFYHENIFTKDSSINSLAESAKEKSDNNERIWPVINERADMSDIGIGPNRNIINELNLLNGFTTFLPQEYIDITKFNERGMNNSYSELLRNNELISSLNTKLIIVPDQLNAEIDNINSTNYSEKSTVFESKEIKLPSSLGVGIPSILQEELTLEPNTMYRLSIDFKTPPKELVYVDLYGENYDNDSQQMNVNINGKIKFSKNIYSGSDLPEKVYYRIFSFSKDSIDIDSWKLEKYSVNNEVNLIYKKETSNAGYSIYENLKVLPKIYSLSETLESDKDYSNIFDLDLHKISIVNDLNANKYSLAEIKDVKYNAGFASAKVSSEGQAFVVFSESFFPGWNAYVDGKKTKVYKVNGLTQGIIVPAGEYNVEFRYQPLSLYIGLLLFAVTILYVIILLRKKRKIT